MVGRIYTEKDIESEVRKRVQEHLSNTKKRRIEANQDMLGWRRKVPLWLWHMISSDCYLGWQVDKENNPAWIKLTHKQEESLESEDIARTFDDKVTGLFYYRDFTSSGLPSCSKGEVYWSGWWFQFKEDYDLFLKEYKSLVTETNR
jgi:hypothetical protein